MAGTLDLELVQALLEERFREHEDFSIRAEDDAITVVKEGAQWSPATFDHGELAELVVEGILDELWSSHSQHLAMAFGPRRVGSPLP